MIRTVCASCGKTFKLADEKAGKKGKCPCGAVLQIPGLAPAVTTTRSVTAARSVKAAVPARKMPQATEASIAPSRVENAPESRAGDLAASLASHPLVGKLKPILLSRPVKLGAIVLVTVVIIGAIPVYQAWQHNDESHKSLMRQADESGDRLEASADAFRAQAERDFADARSLRAEADALRESTSSESTPPTRRLRKGEAIAADRFMSAFLDEYPDLTFNVKNGRTAILNPRLDLMVSTGILSPSQVAHIRDFTNQIQSLPD